MMMTVLIKLVVSLLLLIISRTSLAWVAPASSFSSSPHFSRTRSASRSTITALAAGHRDLSEFDYLLSEGGGSQQKHQQHRHQQKPVSASASKSKSATFSRRRIQLPSSHDSIHNHRTTILASSFAAPTTEQTTAATASEGEAVESAADLADATAGADEDPYASSAFDSQLGKIQTFEEQQQKRPTIEQRLKSMDLQDIVVTLILPSIALFASGRWVYNRVSSRVMERGDETLDSFAVSVISSMKKDPQSY
jgi:hypothetical protein